MIETPYNRDQPHPFIASSSESGDGYDYCLICGVAGVAKSPHSGVEPHAFIATGRYGLLMGKLMRCFVCGYRRVNMMHPTEQIQECGAQINLGVVPAQSASSRQLLAPVRCKVDTESSPTHSHYAQIEAWTTDSHFVWAMVTW